VPMWPLVWATLANSDFDFRYRLNSIRTPMLGSLDVGLTQIILTKSPTFIITPVFVVDVYNVSWLIKFVKKKVEKSLLFRFGLKFFDFVSPMLLVSITETASFFIKKPFNLDKRLCTAISGAMVTMMSIFSDPHYHAKLSTAHYHVLILITACCGQGY